MKNLPVIGKYLVVLPMLVFAMFHLTAADAMAGVVPIPGGAIWVYFTGACMIAGVVGIFIGKKAKLAAALMGLMILIFALSVWLPKVIGGDQMAMGTLLRDFAMVGAFWYLSKDLKN